MHYPVCWIVLIKDPLLLIGKCSFNGSSDSSKSSFTNILNHITKTNVNALLNITCPYLFFLGFGHNPTLLWKPHTPASIGIFRSYSEETKKVKRKKRQNTNRKTGCPLGDASGGSKPSCGERTLWTLPRWQKPPYWRNRGSTRPWTHSIWRLGEKRKGVRFLMFDCFLICIYITGIEVF